MWKTLLDYSEEDGWYKITIKGQLVVPKQTLKSQLIRNRDVRLGILAYAKEMIEKEAMWYSCPEWELDYGVCR